VADRTFVIVSGLPASGKSTLARVLAERLSLSLMDKDEILESLFDSLGTGDHSWRHRLSRASDDILFSLAARTPGAVLDNWWNHETAPARLRELGGRLIEVFCDCDPAVAAERFQARSRHPGHLDPQHTPEQVAERVAFVRDTFPGPLHLGGPLLVIDTNRSVDHDLVTRRLDHLIAGTRQRD
jgi:predicted kinase